MKISKKVTSINTICLFILCLYLGETCRLEHISVLPEGCSEHNIFRNGGCSVFWKMFWGKARPRSLHGQGEETCKDEGQEFRIFLYRVSICELYQNYEDPVNDSYEETGKMYNRVVDFMMDNIAENLSENRINMVVATHNEAGALHAANMMLR